MEVELNGQVFFIDACNDSATYLWEQLSGPTSTIADPTSLQTTVTLTTTGTYVFQLTGTDQNNNTSTDTCTITFI